MINNLYSRCERQLFPAEVRAQIPALYSNEGKSDPMIVAKFFNPMGAGTWYIIEGSPIDENGEMIPENAPESKQARAVDFLFYGYVDLFEGEFGYFSLSEIEQVDLPFGMKIERDIFFRPTPQSTVVR